MELTKVCSRCDVEKPVVSFKRYTEKRKRHLRRGVCQLCRGRQHRASCSPEQKEATREYHRQYHRANPWRARIKAYQHHDKVKGRESIGMALALELMSKNPCFYCGTDDRYELGLDRVDNSQGHSIDNVRVCCMTCNFILGDLPVRAKDLLREGLRSIKQAGILDDYIIPVKRNKSRKRKC